MIKFKNTTFYYFLFENQNPYGINIVYRDFTFDIPSGIVSFVGQNGCGKSTLLGLISARLQPCQGDILIDNINTRQFANLGSEIIEKRNKLISFIYQNMEFEDDKSKLGDIFEHVFALSKNKAKNLIEELTDIFEFKHLLNSTFSTLSKGEFQRCLLILSILYDAKINVYDEPVFAMEDYQKEKAFEYLYDYHKKQNKSMYFALHDIDIVKKYSDKSVVFIADKEERFSPYLKESKDLEDFDLLEKIFQIPANYLYSKQNIIKEDMLKKDKDLK